jgi:hypothetical protein
METGSKGYAPEMKAYKIVDKIERFGERTGLFINHRFTRISYIFAGIVIVLVFGTAALIRAFCRGTFKKQ